MSILKIARMGHPVLLQKTEPVADPTAPEIRRLVADMYETMEDALGAGLGQRPGAAPANQGNARSRRPCRPR
jgi:peptide deformylase